MSNPLVAQGTLNRLRGAVIVPQFPNLNVTAPFLTKEGIRLAVDGNSTQRLDTMTGQVTSGEPYLPVTVTIHVLKTNGLAELYKQQLEDLSLIGPITVIPDTSGLGNFNFHNCSINGIPSEVSFAGDEPGMAISLGGIYYINASLWDPS